MLDQSWQEIVNRLGAVFELGCRPNGIHVFARDPPFHREEIQNDVTLLNYLRNKNNQKKRSQTTKLTRTSTCKFGPKMCEIMLLLMSQSAMCRGAASASGSASPTHNSARTPIWLLIWVIPAKRIVNVLDVKYLNAKSRPSKSNAIGVSKGSLMVFHIKSTKQSQKQSENKHHLSLNISLTLLLGHNSIVQLQKKNWEIKLENTNKNDEAIQPLIFIT